MNFHLLARPARWWHPVVELVIFLLTSILFAGLWYGACTWLQQRLRVPDSALTEDHPLGLVDSLMYIIIMLPAAVVAVTITRRRRTGTLWSAAGGVRWGWLARCIPPVALAYAVYLGASLAMDGPGEFHVDARAVTLLGIIVVLVPLQATAEEVVFRGWLPQLVGVWIRSPWVAYSVCIPVFVWGHDYGVLGLTDVTTFALAAAYLTYRTGGLEAAMVLHAVSNIVVFSQEALGVIESATSDTEVTVSNVLLSVAVTAATTMLLLRAYARWESAQGETEPDDALPSPALPDPALPDELPASAETDAAPR